MVLTNGEIFGKQIFLGENDSIENYNEISEAEPEALQNERVE